MSKVKKNPDEEFEFDPVELGEDVFEDEDWDSLWYDGSDDPETDYVAEHEADVMDMLRGSVLG